MRMLCWPLRPPFSFQGVKERLPRKAAKRLSFARQAPLVFGIIKLFDVLVIVTRKAGLIGDRAAHHVDRCLKKTTPYLGKGYKIGGIWSSKRTPGMLRDRS
jgi:hypothetical protein